VSGLHDSCEDFICGWLCFALVQDFCRPERAYAIFKFFDSTIEGISRCLEPRVARRIYDVLSGFLVNPYDVAQELSVVMAEVKDKHFRSQNEFDFVCSANCGHSQKKVDEFACCSFQASKCCCFSLHFKLESPHNHDLPIGHSPAKRM
jgi:hypothetical protein